MLPAISRKQLTVKYSILFYLFIISINIKKIYLSTRKPVLNFIFVFYNTTTIIYTLKQYKISKQ